MQYDKENGAIEELSKLLKITDAEIMSLRGALTEYMRIDKIIKENREKLCTANKGIKVAIARFKEISAARQGESLR